MANVPSAAPSLNRNLSLLLVVLYGLGVTIGAGIYVLVGEVAGRAGDYAPWSFAVAGLVMIGPAAVYAELSGRLPYAAGQVHYVEEGLGQPQLALIAGLAVTAVAVMSSAAIALGTASYLRAFVDLPAGALAALVILAMGAIAGWGVRESLTIAGLFTFVEIAGLIVIVAAGFFAEPAPRATAAVAAMPSGAAWAGIFSASLLGFFAFIGFEDIVNMAEETHEPQKTLARAIFLTLGLSTLLYVAVAYVAVRAVPPADLARQEAALAYVFTRVTGWSPGLFAMVAIMATLNGVIAQIVMASRILYGLSAKGYLPRPAGRVNARTRTPFNATLMVTAAVLALALLFPIGELAEWTSRVTLAVTSLVCLSLVVIKLKRTPAPPGTLIVPIALPAFGLLMSLALLLAGGL